MSAGLRSNPDASSEAAPARVSLVGVSGTRLYTEVRGTGPSVLLIGAADEDAEVYRAIAERIVGHTVVTYDRRGTLRSGRDQWPGGDSAQHADDAAGLVEALDLAPVTVFGASAGGIVALRLALDHPELVRRALVYEPGLLLQTPEGSALRERGQLAIEQHLEAHPADWAGAVSALGRVAVETTSPDERGLFAPPEGMEWYAERCDEGAEALIRGDLPLTRERIDERELASAAIEIRFAHGERTLPVFRDIAAQLSNARRQTPDLVPDATHAAYYHPDEIAAYILTHTNDAGAA